MKQTMFYDIYTYTACLFLFKEEYETLLNPILQYVRTTSQSCDVHIGVCKYEFKSHDKMVSDQFPNIHVVFSAQDTTKIEKVVEEALAKNGYYKHFNKFIIEDNELAASHIKFFEENSTRQDKIKVTYSDKKKVVSIAYQDVIDI